MKVLVYKVPSRTAYYYNALNSRYFYGFAENFISFENARRASEGSALYEPNADFLEALEFVCVVEV